jgi:hypothetical protein
LVAPLPPPALRRSAFRRAAAAAHGRVLVVAWGEPVNWRQASVAKTAPAAEGLRSVFLSVPADVAGSFKAPGQYLQAR